jgi:Peptidase family S41
MKKLIILFIIINGLATIAFAQTPKKYSAQEVKDDLEYMYDMLEKCSYDLFALNSKENMDKMYSSTYESINDSLTKLEIYRKYMPLLAAAKMSHCMMNKPWGYYINHYVNKGGALFPLSIYFRGDKALVHKNYSANSTINEHDEILSINEKPINEFLQDFYENMSGPTEYYINSQIEKTGFPRLCWMFKGEQKSFRLKIKNTNGIISSYSLNAVPASEYEDKINAQAAEDKEERTFEFLNEHAALLTPGGFINMDSNKDLNSPEAFDNTEFCHFIDSAFSSFQQKGIEHLIIDLRDNLGGANSFSDYMIAYFADTSFAISSKMQMKTSQHTKDIWEKLEMPEIQSIKKQIMSLENGSRFDVDIQQYHPHPETKKFKGLVYVLVDRYSYSNAAMTACIIQDYSFGEIIGEETTDEVSSYGSIHKITLPNTKFRVYYPKSFFVRPNGDPTPRGVVPDHIVCNDVLTDDDEVLEYALKLIEGK